MSVENMTWVLIGVTAALFIATRSAEYKAKLMPKGPSAQYEVDVTRWRHDGRQPVGVRDGNRTGLASAFVAETGLAKALGF